MSSDVTLTSLIEDLRSIGVVEGDQLALGISLKSIGIANSPAETLIAALQQVIGPTGTILIPTFTKTSLQSELKLGPNHVFNSELTRSFTGAAAEYLRKLPNAKRSTHPTNSVAAIGAMATKITASHTPNSPSYSPYSTLAELDGKILCIGIGDNLVGLRHEAQYLAGLLTVVPYRYGAHFMSVNKAINTFKRPDPGGCTTRLPELVTDLRQQGLVCDKSIGNAKSILLPVKQSLKYMSDTLSANPDRNLCGDINCLWCREIERRLKLKNTLNNPKYFQSNSVIIRLLSIYNWFRLQDFSVVTKARHLKQNMKAGRSND